MNQGPELVRSTAYNSFTHRLPPDGAVLGPWTAFWVLGLGSDIGAEFRIGTSMDLFLLNLCSTVLDHLLNIVYATPNPNLLSFIVCMGVL